MNDKQAQAIEQALKLVLEFINTKEFDVNKWSEMDDAIDTARKLVSSDE